MSSTDVYDKPINPKKWRKVLYEDQGVPDNYVSETFLDELKKNLHVRHYDYWTVVRESCSVAQQISSICTYVAIFIYMDESLLSPQYLLALSTLFTLVGYLAYRFCCNKDTGHSRTKWEDAKTVLIFIAFGFGLSPILMSLTDTISTDTIYAMCFFMLLANLLFHDYASDSAISSQSVSLNASIFTSVCLASRLPTLVHAFATVTFAVEIFALWPMLRKLLKKRYPRSQVPVTIFSCTVTFLLLMPVSPVGGVLYCLLHLFVIFICPAWLISMQVYKDNIHGPWDEAVVTEVDSL